MLRDMIQSIGRAWVTVCRDW